MSKWKDSGEVDWAIATLEMMTNLSPSSIDSIREAIEGMGMLWRLNQDERNLVMDSLVEVQAINKEHPVTSTVRSIDNLIKRLESSCCEPDKQATGEEDGDE